MGLLDKIFGGQGGPSPRQLRKALKQVLQIHGDAAVRVAAMERLAEWRTSESIEILLRRFTVQVPQGSMDLEEKQHVVRRLTEIGRPAVEPIVNFLETRAEVTWPVRALREILPREEYSAAIRKVLDKLGSRYARWPEAKSALIAHLSDDAYPQVRETLARFLQDDDDDVCIAAVDYLARLGEEEVREKLIETLLECEGRPRVRGRILDHFCDKDWQVKGYRKRVEEILAEPFYLTSKGTVKRRPVGP